MNHVLRPLEASFDIIALSPSFVLASDFAPMSFDVLWLLAAVAGLAVILGIATSTVLVRTYRRRRAWFLTPVLAICWFAVILGVIELWGRYNSRAAPREPAPNTSPEFPTPDFDAAPGAHD